MRSRRQGGETAAEGRAMVFIHDGAEAAGRPGLIDGVCRIFCRGCRSAVEGEVNHHDDGFLGRFADQKGTRAMMLRR